MLDKVLKGKLSKNESVLCLVGKLELHKVITEISIISSLAIADPELHR